jgi:hypothetical protein
MPAAILGASSSFIMRCPEQEGPAAVGDPNFSYDRNSTEHLQLVDARSDYRYIAKALDSKCEQDREE